MPISKQGVTSTLVLSVALGLVACTEPVNRSANKNLSNAKVGTEVKTNAVLLKELLERTHERRQMQGRLKIAPGVAEKFAWHDQSVEGKDKQLQADWRDLYTLRSTIDYSQLDAVSKLNYRDFEAGLKLRIERDSWRYHISPINQIVGLHLEFAGALTNAHPINSREDAIAYIARMESVGVPIDQFIDFLKLREEKGFLLSKSIVPRLIDATESIIKDPQSGENKDSNILLVDFSDKIKTLNISSSEYDELMGRAKKALRQDFIPAHQRLIDSLLHELTLDINDKGVWRMPDGDKFYQFLLSQYTTTDLTAQEVHQLGLQEVARIHKEMNSIISEVGFDGDLQEFFTHLETAPEFYYPNTNEGRGDYLATANMIVNEAKAKVTDILPYPLPRDVKVKRMEAYKEKSAPVAFYSGGSADGPTLGTVYLGMYDMSSVGQFDTRSLLYHEGIPGHHLQVSVMQEQDDIPAIRKDYVWWSNAAFVEGWALYAEYLAKEMGLYDDAYSEFGRLAGDLWRACRLVVDSGLHSERWTRQQAIEYLNENTASSVENNIRAVDRYLAVPGQATAFKVGMMKIQDLRAYAQTEMGARFDLRQFHHIVLRSGPIPLNVLEQEVRDWVEANK